MKYKIALVGTYLPRQCGIATFTHDLYESVSMNKGIDCQVIALNDHQKTYQYPEEVHFQIRQNIIRDYIVASEFINLHQFDVVCLQHEFGIFGGESGRFVIQFLKRIKIPIVVTFHTVLDEPTNEQKEIIRDIATYSHQLIVMSEMGKSMLMEIYGIAADKIAIIGHGIHNRSKLPTHNYRQELEVENKKILLTFGLLSKNKGIETVIKAMPVIREKFPDTVYIVLGASHPHVVQNEGEDYRNSLLKLTQKLHLEENVIFIDRFVSNDELFSFLETSDIYVIPYLSKKQITSGTLMYAMGANNAVVSTPFWHAEEALADERGVFFDFEDSIGLSDSIIRLLENETTLKNYQKAALSYSEQFYWENVASDYLKVFREASVIKKESVHLTKLIETDKIFPELDLSHLLHLTDDTGILQHARYHVPDRHHGYCIDDNARALLLVILLKEKMGEDPLITHLLNTYLSFIDHAYNPATKRFRNFMTYGREWSEEEGSEDSQGRTIWALGSLVAQTYNANLLGYLENLFNYGLDIIPYLTHPRAIAYSIIGLTEHVRKQTEAKNRVMDLLKIQTHKLSAFFSESLKNEEWPWFEECVTYGNSRIAEAMLRGGKALDDKELIQAGFKILDWLIAKQFVHDYFTPIGNLGWWTKKESPRFDQQPIEAHGMVDACLYAASISTNSKYEKYAKNAFDWFLGKNVHGVALYDFSTGGCRDGLHKEGLNKNQGAESTLSWLSSLLNTRLHL